MLLYRSPRQSNGAALIHIKEHTLNPFRSDDYDAGHLPRWGRQVERLHPTFTSHTPHQTLGLCSHVLHLNKAKLEFLSSVKIHQTFHPVRPLSLLANNSWLPYSN